MKVRWTDRSVRLRIDADEYASLRVGDVLQARIAFPGGGAWTVRLRAGAGAFSAVWSEGALAVDLGPDDLDALEDRAGDGTGGRVGADGPEVRVEQDLHGGPRRPGRPAQD